MMIQMMHLRDSTGQVKTQKLHTMLTCELLSEQFLLQFSRPGESTIDLNRIWVRIRTASDRIHKSSNCYMY